MVPLTGPEVLAGSTRLKAGTATKLVLNTITTAATPLVQTLAGRERGESRSRDPERPDNPRPEEGHLLILEATQDVRVGVSASRR